MDLRNKPVQAITKFDEDGSIIPLRIRLEDDEQNRVTANIDNIVYANDNIYAGINTIDYGCKVTLDEREQFLELRYHVASHKWTIRKVLY